MARQRQHQLGHCGWGKRAVARPAVCRTFIGLPTHEPFRVFRACAGAGGCSAPVPENGM